MSELSPLELWTRRLLGLGHIVADKPFGERMLARAVRQLGEAEPKFRDKFLAALADAIDGSDKHCSVKVVRTGKRGPRGSGGRVASLRQKALADAIRERCDKRMLGDAAETQAKVLDEYMARHGVELSQARNDLAAGRKAQAALRLPKIRGTPPNS